MAASINIPKKSLEASTMYRYHVQGGPHHIDNKVVWEIKNFCKLRDGIYYTSFYEPYGWKLSLIKKRNFITMGININRNNQEVKCSIFGDNENVKYTARTKEIGKGLYEAKFQRKDYNENILANSSLKLQFNILRKAWTEKLRSSTEVVCDDKGLSEDLDDALSKLKERVDYHDFTLHGKYYLIPVHKSILAARSTFFLEYFQQYPQSNGTELTTEKYFLDFILSFIYTGKIRLPGRLVRTMGVFESAVTLGVTGLKSILTFYLQQCINENTVHDIKELGIKTQVKALVEAAVTFLEHNEKSRKK